MMSIIALLLSVAFYAYAATIALKYRQGPAVLVYWILQGNITSLYAYLFPVHFLLFAACMAAAVTLEKLIEQDH